MLAAFWVPFRPPAHILSIRNRLAHKGICDIDRILRNPVDMRLRVPVRFKSDVSRSTRAMEAKMITLKFLGKYWTVLVDGKPLMQFASLEDAIAFAPEAGYVAAVA